MMLPTRDWLDHSQSYNAFGSRREIRVLPMSLCDLDALLGHSDEGAISPRNATLSADLAISS
jgi:hypothetical protein